MKKNRGLDLVIFTVLVIAGILLGRIISMNYQGKVKEEVKEILNRVIMIDVPPIDNEANYYLENNNYTNDYLTAIDISSGDYGIFEIKNNKVVAYAHGECQSVGNTKPGIYKIVETKSHLDYHDARYWNIVKLKEIHTDEEIYVSTPPYEIDDRPITLSDRDELNGVEITDEIMLTVYDNGSIGTVLLVIDGTKEEFLDGKNHQN